MVMNMSEAVRQRPIYNYLIKLTFPVSLNATENLRSGLTIENTPCPVWLLKYILCPNNNNRQMAHPAERFWQKKMQVIRCNNISKTASNRMYVTVTQKQPPTRSNKTKEKRLNVNGRGVFYEHIFCVFCSGAMQTSWRAIVMLFFSSNIIAGKVRPSRIQ